MKQILQTCKVDCFYWDIYHFTGAKNGIFGWSSMLKDPRQIPWMQKLRKENLPLAMLIFIGMTIVGSVLLAPCRA